MFGEKFPGDSGLILALLTETEKEELEKFTDAEKWHPTAGIWVCHRV